MTTSLEDRIQAELWRGAIPVEIHLAADEVVDLKAPPPFFGLIPRGAYLPVWHDQETESSPRRHFEPFIAKFPEDLAAARTRDDSAGHEDARPDAAHSSGIPRRTRSSARDEENKIETPCWFDHDGAPLRWNVCAGILHDVLVQRDADGAVASAGPWRLTVHYAAYGDRGKEPLPLDGDGTQNRRDAGLFACSDPQSCVRADFFNALKEATHIERGSAAGVMSMTRAAQTDLWRSVVTGDRRLATAAEAALSVSSVPPDGPEPHDTSRRIPVRVYTEASDVTPGRSSRRGVVWTSAPVPVFARGGGSRKASARDALALVAPLSSDDDANDGEWRCFVQGVDVRLDAPLDALHARMRGADRFLHVCVVRGRAPQERDNR